MVTLDVVFWQSFVTECQVTTDNSSQWGQWEAAIVFTSRNSSVSCVSQCRERNYVNFCLFLQWWCVCNRGRVECRGWVLIWPGRSCTRLVGLTASLRCIRQHFWTNCFAVGRHHSGGRNKESTVMDKPKVDAVEKTSLVVEDDWRSFWSIDSAVLSNLSRWPVSKWRQSVCTSSSAHRRHSFSNFLHPLAECFRLPSDTHSSCRTREQWNRAGSTSITKIGDEIKNLQKLKFLKMWVLNSSTFIFDDLLEDERTTGEQVDRCVNALSPLQYWERLPSK